MFIKQKQTASKNKGNMPKMSITKCNKVLKFLDYAHIV